MNTLTTEPDRHACLIPYQFKLPEWLQECLIKQSSDSLSADPDNDLICRAFQFAHELHQGQCRKSGEPYIIHPVEVAGILRDMGSSAMIAAGFLHDVIEDTDVTGEEIEQRFGSEIRQLVEGVTKLSKLHFSSKTELQAENFRRMFVAMAQDIRVIIVKFADRLHNMRTLEFLPPEKQRQVALETKEIFAPLANRLGMWRFKWELEDLSFKYIDPEGYRQMQTLVAEKRVDRDAQIREVVCLLRQHCTQAGINWLDVSGRAKHLYSIYQKMERRQKEFSQIYDLAAIRLIVETKEECYRALAIVHDLFRPMPGRFKDYIGLPKPNNYQSLHTTVISPTGKPLEVQIRTIEMHHVAEYGIAAHWKYKQTGTASQLTSKEYKFNWLRQLVDWQNDLKDANEYLETIKIDLFSEDIFVFTPKGDVVALSQGSTPVDFAYRIHTEVGNQCVGARINNRWSGLDTKLQNGDVVEIQTSKTGHPSLGWLNFVVTPSAKNRIKQWYKRCHREEHLAKGRELLERELGKKGLETLLKSEPMQAVAERCNYRNVDDLLAGLGNGEFALNSVVSRIRDIIKAKLPPELEKLPEKPPGLAKPELKSDRKYSPIVGVEGLLHHLAGCCHPLPGEPIIGVVTHQRGISIHSHGCSNLEKIPADRLVPVHWNSSSNGQTLTYPVNIEVEALDRIGLLKDVLSHLADRKINLRSAHVKTEPNQPTIIHLCIDIANREQLEQVCNRVKKMSDVLHVRQVVNASS